MLQIAAARKGWKSRRLQNRQQILIAMQDGEGERSGRLFPGRAHPDKPLPWANHLPGLNELSIEMDVPATDPLRPLSERAVGKTPREVRLDRPTPALRDDALGVGIA